MLGHMRKHHTNRVHVTPNKTIQDIPEKDENITWRESAKGLIEKYTEAGLMIRGARDKSEMTQKQLAEKLGVKPHHISEMEHGKRSIGKAMAKRLSEVLGVSNKVFL